MTQFKWQEMLLNWLFLQWKILEIRFQNRLNPWTLQAEHFQSMDRRFCLMWM